MKEIIKVYVKKAGKKAELKEIKNDLGTLQRLVGGYIETVTLGDAVVICNEEGRLHGLPTNCVVITKHGVTMPFVGTIVIADIDSGDFTDCTATATTGGLANERLYLTWGNAN